METTVEVIAETQFGEGAQIAGVFVGETVGGPLMGA